MEMSSTKNNDNSALAGTPSMAPGTRRSKRKREQICYTEQFNDDDLPDENDVVEPQSIDKRSKIFKRKKSKPLLKKKVLGFMDLPAELKNKIYKMLLVERPLYPAIIRSNMKSHRPVASCSPGLYTKCRPRLLTTSRQMHAEAAPIFYSQHFTMDDTQALVNFLSQIGTRHSTLLRHITIRNWCTRKPMESLNFAAMALLAHTAPHLERLCIDGAVIECASLKSPRSHAVIPIRLARQVYRCFLPWLEAVGRAKGNIVAGIEMLDLEWPHLRYLHEVRDPHGMYRGELEALLRNGGR